MQERSVNIGLQKLKEASLFVEKLKIQLKEQEASLGASDPGAFVTGSSGAAAALPRGYHWPWPNEVFARGGA